MKIESDHNIIGKCTMYEYYGCVLIGGPKPGPGSDNPGGGQNGLVLNLRLRDVTALLASKFQIKI